MILKMLDLRKKAPTQEIREHCDLIIMKYQKVLLELIGKIDVTDLDLEDNRFNIPKKKNNHG